MRTEVLERAFASTEVVLTNVTADQMDLPTPCVSWTPFGPKVDVPDSASAADKLAGFMGRRV